MKWIKANNLHTVATQKNSKNNLATNIMGKGAIVMAQPLATTATTVESHTVRLIDSEQWHTIGNHVIWKTV